MTRRPTSAQPSWTLEHKCQQRLPPASLTGSRLLSPWDPPLTNAEQSGPTADCPLQRD